jgi:excisionase family DNA binding protein
MSESYVYKMVSNKSIPHIKLGTRTLFERNQIDNWVINGGRVGEERWILHFVSGYRRFMGNGGIIQGKDEAEAEILLMIFSAIMWL